MLARIGPMLVAALLGQVAADAQDPQYAGRTVQEVLEEFRAAGINLIYNEREIEPGLRVQREPAGQGPAEILSEVLAPHGLALEQVRPDSYIVIRALPGPSGRVWGLVRDGASQRRIAGAEIHIDDYPVSRSSDDGQYLFTGLPDGLHELRVSAPGYRSAGPLALEIEPDRTTVMMLELMPRSLELETMVVTVSRYSLLERRPDSHWYLGQAEVINQPDLGEDAVRAVNRLPGVASAGLSAKANIRGGEENETLILFDGMRLREPFHLKNFQDIFSTLDPGWIGGIDVYTGGFTADYGDRMSAVIDMRAHRPEQLVHQVALSFFNLALQSEGSFATGRGTWLAGLRRGTLDLLVEAVEPQAGSPVYADATVQLRYALNDATAISLNALSSNDRLTLANPNGVERANAEYRNNHVWFKLDHTFSESLAASALLGLTRFDDDRTGVLLRPELAIGRVDDRRNFSIVSLRQDWAWTGSERFLSRWGMELEWLDGDYRYASEVDFQNGIGALFGRPAAIDRQTLRNVDGNRYAVYLTERLRLGERLVAEAGLRWDRQTYTRPAIDEQWSPRLSLLYHAGRSTRLRAGWGLYYQAQGIEEMQVEDGVERFFPPQRAEHTILSLEHEFGRGLRLRVEAFRKIMSDLRPRFENQLNPLVLLPELEPDRIRIAPDLAELVGVELMLRADHRGPWSWWLSYSRSHTEDEFGGAEVRRSWDQSNALGFGLTWQGEHWVLGAAGGYHTGWPTTAVQTDAGEDPPFTLGARNAERFTDFATLDLRISREFELRRGSLLLFAEISNALNRRNPCCSELELEPSPDGTLQPRIETEDWLPLVPSLGVRWQF